MSRNLKFSNVVLFVITPRDQSFFRVYLWVIISSSLPRVEQSRLRKSHHDKSCPGDDAVHRTSSGISAIKVSLLKLIIVRSQQSVISFVYICHLTLVDFNITQRGTDIPRANITLAPYDRELYATC